MKRALILLFVFCLVVVPALAWIDPPNFGRLLREADVVAVVRVVSVVDTGTTNRLNYFQGAVVLREVDVRLHVESLLAGIAADKIAHRLYRFPTENESALDHPDRESRSAERFASLDQHSMFVPLPNTHYLAYLRWSTNGYYLATTGYEFPAHSLFHLESPSHFNVDGGLSSADRKSVTNSVPAAPSRVP